ncbi:MAG: hypothetical protein KJ767_01595 [Nanoarchaeota archaeon]|nr:hypothetical protein [Nanoarchaeota archaeon]
MKREFDRKIWKSGNSYVITIPAETVERFKLEGKYITVAISDEDTILLEVKEEQKKKNKKKGGGK